MILQKTSAFSGFLILVLFFSACSREEHKTSPVSVIVNPVVLAELPRTYFAVGQIVPKENVFLVARVTGFLTKRLFEPGTFVKKGQLLFQIQKDQYIAQLERSKSQLLKAEAAYDNALIEFNRQTVLYKQNATSQEKLDTATQNKLIAEGDLGVAKSDLELQELNLSYTDIYSPFDGRIGMYTYSVGNEVSQGSNPLAQVIMINPIWIEFPVSEKHLEDMMEIEHVLPSKADKKFISENVVVKIILANGTEYPLTGAIDFINNEIDPLAGTIQMRAVFQNPQEKLVPGGYVTVRSETVKKFPKLMIMQIAMQEDQLGTFVYTVNKDNIVAKRYIKKGEVVNDVQIIVEDGLQEGEMVIVGGVLRVKPGMKVDRALVNPNINFSALMPSVLSKSESFPDSSRLDSSRVTSKNN